MTLAQAFIFERCMLRTFVRTMVQYAGGACGKR